MTAVKRRYVDLTADEKALVTAKQEALFPHFQARSVGFFDDDRRFFGSGTLVEHRGRLFVATADHVAAAIQAREEKVILFHGAGPSTRGPRVDHRLQELGGRVLRRSGGARRLDVAAIELPRSAERKLTSMTFTKSPGALAGEAQPGNIVWLLGTPSAIRSAEQEAAGNSNLETFGVLLTHLRDEECAGAPHESDGLEDGYGSDPRSDLHVEWTEALWPSGRWADLPPAGGMSGGGVWTSRAGLDEIWTPDKAQLLGIAWYQRRDLGCIRAVPVREWLALADAIVDEVPAP